MELNEFMKNFAAQFEETDVNMFKAETNFRNEIDEWDSLRALSIIAMVDAEYGITIRGEDIRNCKTIEDLFNIVKSRK